MLFKFNKYICFILFMQLIINPVFAINENYVDNSQVSEQLELNNNKYKQLLYSGIKKYENLNIQISHNEFSDLINENKNNDLFMVELALKTAELGFFDLTELALNNMTDENICKNYTNNIRKYILPKNSIQNNDIIILAELNSNILYNDQAKEATTELLTYPRFLRDYDYANYIMALGYYKLNNINEAKLYINEALKLNPNNLNYEILKSKIFVEDKKGKISKKILNKLKKRHENNYTFINKINTEYEYIMYKISKETKQQDYHLGRYYLMQGEISKAIRLFQSALSKDKKINALCYSNLSKAYFIQNDIYNAKINAQNAYKINKHNSMCLIILGDIEYQTGNYKSALEYYKSASNNKDLRQNSLEKIANVYSKLSYKNKSNKLYEYINKKYPNSYISYYRIGLLNNEHSIENIKQALSINISYQDAWIDLARIMLEKEDFQMAQKYLNIAKYLDGNNFRYYYYQSLLLKKQTELNNYIRSIK